MNTTLRITTMAFLIAGCQTLAAQNGPTLPSPECPAATQNLVSYWSFDESSGLALDPISGNNGELGPSVARVAGILGSGAVSFDNHSGAYVNVGPGVNNDFSFTTGITISVITKPDWTGNFGDYDDFFRKDDGNSRILLAFQNDNGVCCPFYGGGGKGQVLSFGLNVGGVYDEIDMPLDGLNGRPTLAQLEDGNAHWILATYDSSTGVKAIYIDGVLGDAKNYPVGSLISSGGSADAIIGNWESSVPPFGEPYNGVLDELRIYSGALTPSAIQCVQFTTLTADVQNSLTLGLIDNEGIANALSSMVTAAADDLSAGTPQIAVSQLNDAILFVGAQQGQHIDPVVAERLLSELILLRQLAMHA